MNCLVSWQLLLFLCATSLGDPLEKGAPVENPRAAGQQLRPQDLLAAWAQSPRCAETRPAAAALSPRGAPLCAPPDGAAGPQRPGPCAPRSRLIPAPRGAVLVQREKDLSAYNWNSFGLRYGKRQAAPGSRRGPGAGRAEGARGPSELQTRDEGPERARPRRGHGAPGGGAGAPGLRQ
ncbi:metastasis-suppressor KiSS-1 [Microcebus murinus]|uniref:metastasis-suppressor KiSS-1 n=1 Tax=Microcebus murinus TaxID=30608 RepID=UPI003F6D206A